MQPARDLADKLKPRLANDFQRRLLDATMLSAQAADNPLRLNNFSTSFRELFRHVLAELAPDSEVVATSWYVPDMTSRSGITRGHKIAYVIHGGLAPTYVETELEIEVDAERSGLVKSIDTLSKFTHVNEKTFDAPDVDVSERVLGACLALARFLDCAKEARRVLCGHVEERIHDDVVSEAIGETLLAVDEIAPHHSLENVYVESIEITDIDSKEIHFIAYGAVEVVLQWGSNSDVRRGDGAEMSESYPLTCEFISKVSAPEELTMVRNSLCVDTTSWWNDYYDDEPDGPTSDL